MIKSFREINDSLIDEVCKCFEKGDNFNYLKNKYQLEHNVLYSILYSTCKYNRKIYNYLCQKTIRDTKIIFISDTHYGSKKENIKYIYDVFNFAAANGIHIILHGGDVLESDFDPENGYNNVIKQANYFINIYPFDNDIKTYTLLGNHDYLAINQCEMIRDILDSRNDIDILGFKKAYLKWLENVISLQHDIEPFKLNLPLNAEIISFKGHSHFYHIRERKNGINERVYIPCMCDPLSTNYLNGIEGTDKPGFLTAEIDDSSIIVNNYSFCDKKIIKENEFIKVLKK